VVKFAGTTDEAALPVGSDEPVGHESRTRDRIARSILENGPSTASALSARIQLTATAVRRHLDALLADGLIEEVAPRTSAVRGRGRPARLFAVTDAGRDSFDQGYDDLAASAMQFLEQHGGREAVAAFARQRVAELEERYRPVVELCQHHCPVAHVAEKYPELCEAETEAFGRLLGTHVQRLATIAHGDGVCTTYVPRTTTLPSPAHRRTAQ